MAEVSIVDRGCRGCTLCVDVCPVNVFDYDTHDQLARVARAHDCIGCLSCGYACPSGCVEVTGVEVIRPFHRIEDHVELIERFLQTPSARTTLTSADLEEARTDVAARLLALARAVVETMGRGHKAVGRRAGAVAASHLPEMYEHRALDRVVARLESEIGQGFAMRSSIRDGNVGLELSPCALCAIVESAGQTVGHAVLCELFHEFLAGLLSAYAGVTYACEVPRAGAACEVLLKPAR